jgi:hypothetical protein
MMSVRIPLIKLKPTVMIPLNETSEGLVVEIQLPKKEVDPDKLWLLDSRTGRPIPMERLTHTLALNTGYPRVRFHFASPEVRRLLPFACVYYFDLNPQLDWFASYTVELCNRKTSPNEARIKSFVCDVHFRNRGDRRVGPGRFQIMVHQGESTERPLMAMTQAPAPVMAMRKSMARMKGPVRERKMAMAEEPSEAESFAVPSMPSMPSMSETGSDVAEGFLIRLPGDAVTFEKFSSGTIPIFELRDVPVRKTHSIVLVGPIKNGRATVKYTFHLSDDKSNVLLPRGNLDLFSEHMAALIGTHRISKPLVAGSAIKLFESLDEKVPVDGNVISEQYEVDTDGNQLIVYSGGLDAKNLYVDRSNLRLHIFVPVAKSVVEMKKITGVASWKYEAQQSRVKLILDIPSEEKAHVRFVIYNRDPVRIHNKNRLNVKLTEEKKRQILETLLANGSS